MNAIDLQACRTRLAVNIYPRWTTVDAKTTVSERSASGPATWASSYRPDAHNNHHSRLRRSYVNFFLFQYYN